MASDQITLIAAFLMQGLAAKTGGFGTEGDMKRAFDVAELMYAESLKRAPKWREMRDKAEGRSSGG